MILKKKICKWNNNEKDKLEVVRVLCSFIQWHRIFEFAIIYRYSSYKITLSGSILLLLVHIAIAAALLVHATLVKHSRRILEVSFTHVLRRFFETSNGFIFEYLKLLTHLIIADFIELLGLFVVHSSLDEVRVRLLRRCKLVEQERRVRVTEEASEIAFAVFVAHIAN